MSMHRLAHRLPPAPFDMGMAQNPTTRGPQVLVHVSIYPGSIWVPTFDPQPYGKGLSDGDRIPRGFVWSALGLSTAQLGESEGVGVLVFAGDPCFRIHDK